MDIVKAQTNSENLEENFNSEDLSNNLIQINTINEEEEELDQMYCCKNVETKVKKNQSSSKQRNNFQEDGEYLNIHRDEEPNEVEAEEEFIDFNNQNAYQTDNSQESQKSEENFNEGDSIIKNDNQIAGNEFQNTKDYSIISPEENQVNSLNPLNEVLDQKILKEEKKENPKLKKKENKTKKITQTFKNKEELKAKKFFEDNRETKTIFSKISEDLIYKLSKDKFHKSSSYDFMTNDIYINRVVEKSDQSNNKFKFHDFVERNNEYFINKKLRLEQRIQKIAEASSSNISGLPNKKVFERSELRNANEFYENQKNYILQKQQFLEEQRKEQVKRNEFEAHNHIPEIDKNSRKIAKNKQESLNKNEEVFSRLHNQKINKNKKQIFNDLDEKDNKQLSSEKVYMKLNSESPKEESIIKNRSFSLKLKGVKQNSKDLEVYCNKLHNDAKNKIIRNEKRAEKIYGKKEKEFQSKSSKILNIKIFIANFGKALKDIIQQKIFNKSENIKNDTLIEQNDLNVKLTFADYCSLIEKLSFINYDYQTIQIFLNNNDERDTKENFITKKNIFSQRMKLLEENKKELLMQKQIKKEAKLIQDSWSILLSNLSFECEIEDIETVEAKEILIFLCVIQGFLKGDSAKNTKIEEDELELIKLNKFLHEINKKESRIFKEKLKESIMSFKNTDNYSKSQGKNLPKNYNLENLPQESSLEQSKKRKVGFSHDEKYFNYNVLNHYEQNNKILDNYNDKELNIPSPRSLEKETNLNNNSYKSKNSENKNYNRTDKNRIKSILETEVKNNMETDKDQIQNCKIINDNNIINQFFPFIDLKNFHYSKSIICKKIKFIFRTFCENKRENNENNKIKHSKNVEEKSAKIFGDRNFENDKNKFFSKNRINNKVYYEKYKKRVVSQIENELTLNEILNTSENRCNSHDKNNKFDLKTKRIIKMEDAYNYQIKKKEIELNKLRLERKNEESKNCTFQPNVHKPYENKKKFNLKFLIDKLYKEGLEKIKEKNDLIKKIQEELLKKELDPKVLTFKPSINPMNETVFKDRNIEAFEISKKYIERSERFRIEKKIAQIQKQTGLTNLNQLTSIDSLLKDSNHPSWDFSLEKKTYKDTFNNTKKFSTNASYINDKPHFSTISNTLKKPETSIYDIIKSNSRKIEEKAFILDITIDHDSSAKQLKVNLSDDATVVANEFALKYDLNDEKKLKLISLIDLKINEIKFMHTHNTNKSISPKMKT